MTPKRLVPVVAALVLFSLTVYFMGPLTQAVADAFWLRPGVAETIGLISPVQVTKSPLIQHKALASPDILPIYGSSELRSGGRFAPGVVFEGKPTGFTTFYMGGPVFKSLPHAVNLAGQENLANRKLVFFLPSDWFFGGLPSAVFAKNFSALDVYQTLFSPSLPAKLRRAIILRLLQYRLILKNHPILDAYLQSYEGTGWQGAPVHLAEWPVARLDFASLQLRDAITTISIVKKLNPKAIAANGATSPVEHPLAWNTLAARALRQGRALIKNPYGIDNSMLKGSINPRTAGSQDAARIDNSPEYADLDLLLAVLKAKEARPLFVILPYNGPYRDYTGFPVSERQRHYQRLRRMLARYGFPFVDLSSQEYVPYYFNDPVHPSARAWVPIDRILDDYYHGTLVLHDHRPDFIAQGPAVPALPPDPGLKAGRVSPPAWLSRQPYTIATVWRVGDQPDLWRHVWDPAYAFSGSPKNNPPQGFIGTFAGNGASGRGVWKTPGLWGSVSITNVRGDIVSFTASSGLKGTFNLDTHAWKRQ